LYSGKSSVYYYGIGGGGRALLLVGLSEFSSNREFVELLLDITFAPNYALLRSLAGGMAG